MEIHDCPCCGADDVYVDFDGEYYVQCGNCAYAGDAMKTKEAAIQVWNKTAEDRWELLADLRELMAG